MLPEYARDKITNLKEEDLTFVLTAIVEDSIIENRLYCDCDDVERALREIMPTITAISHNTRFLHLKADYSTLVEGVTLFAIKLA